jgi:hypothetical protein
MKSSNSRRGASIGKEEPALALIQSDEQAQEREQLRLRRVVGAACCQRHRLGSEGKSGAVRGESQVTGTDVARLTAGFSSVDRCHGAQRDAATADRSFWDRGAEGAHETATFDAIDSGPSAGAVRSQKGLAGSTPAGSTQERLRR